MAWYDDDNFDFPAAPAPGGGLPPVPGTPPGPTAAPVYEPPGGPGGSGGGGGVGQPECPDGTHPVSGQCVPDERPDEPGRQGQCPPGEVWRSDSQGHHGTGQPGCEPEDWRSKSDRDTCLDKRPNCGEGYDAWCDFTTATWKCGYIGGGGGRGGGGAAAPKLASGGGGGFDMSKLGSNAFDDFLKKYIMGALEKGSRYSPEVLERLKGEVTRHRSSAFARGEAAIRQDAARRGMSRAGSTGASIRRLQEGVEAESGKQLVGIETDKLNADWTDKMAAIDRGQKYLDSLRDNEYRYMLSADQRKQFDANLALSYAQLAQQKSMLQMQLQSAWDMNRSNQGFAALLASMGFR